MTRLMSIEDFVNEGYLQEVNRQFLHPLGLALAVEKSLGVGYQLQGVVDSRVEPDGMIFAKPPSIEKALYIVEQQRLRAVARLRTLGYVEQPVAISKEE